MSDQLRVQRMDASYNLLSRDDFRSCIIRTTATSLEKVSIGHDIRQAKVANLDIEEFVQ